MGKLNNFKNFIKNIILCLKYPFLWPRNVYSGLHYTNWELEEWINKKKGQATFGFTITRTKDKDKISGDIEKTLPNGDLVYLEKRNNHTLQVIYRKQSWRNLERILDTLEIEEEIVDYSWERNEWDRNSLPTLILQVSGEIKTTFQFKNYIISPWLYFQAKIISLIYKYPLQIFHCLPGYTNLDQMPKGWRDAFGEEMCKEIRNTLFRNHGISGVLKFRILQIKEKYVGLRFYFNGPLEIDEIVDKYTELSERTCIICGKPAKWISKGWISPYCDDHIENKDYADRL